jgi:hypothetical protein
MIAEPFLKRQIIPVGLTIVVCIALIGLLYLEILLLNTLTQTDISLQVHWVDILIGLTIYLKTSIDFAIYIGNLMDRNPGWKNRVAIEIGTALGNAAGTLAILIIWDFFREIRWLMVIMITIAALVLFKLAEEGLEHAKAEDKQYPAWFRVSVAKFEKFLETINTLVLPILRYIIPNVTMKTERNASWGKLFILSFSVPFILGLDDFAGYVPLFSIINVFGFAIGVFLGHMLLNMLLYISPEHTIRAVKNPVISFLGSIAFVLIGVWGLYEAVKLIGH